jgi:hypothetical protein
MQNAAEVGPGATVHVQSSVNIGPGTDVFMGEGGGQMDIKVISQTCLLCLEIGKICYTSESKGRNVGPRGAWDVAVEGIGDTTRPQVRPLCS